jgi:hypothetical protein
MAEKLQCFRDNPRSSWVHCVNTVLSWIPFGSNFQCDDLSSDTTHNIKQNCGIIPGFPQYTSWTPIQKRLCVSDKVHQEYEVLNTLAGCKLYVCRHHASCVGYLLSLSNVASGTDRPDLGGKHCGHSWTEETLGSSKLIADASNNIYITCPA